MLMLMTISKIIYQLILLQSRYNLKITQKMGNECSECEPAVGECKMRDVFKEQPRNRADLDLSEIKKGEYKRKATVSILREEGAGESKVRGEGVDGVVEEESDVEEILPPLMVESNILKSSGNKLF